MKTKNRILLASHYTYLEKINAKRVKQKAAEWGSGSNYLNYLVAKDHGDKESMQASKDLQAEFFEPAPLRSRAKVAKPAKKAKGKKSKPTAKAGKKAVSKKRSAKLKKPADKLLKAKKKASHTSKKKSSKSPQSQMSKLIKKATSAATAIQNSVGV